MIPRGRRRDAVRLATGPRGRLCAHLLLSHARCRIRGRLSGSAARTAMFACKTARIRTESTAWPRFRVKWTRPLVADLPEAGRFDVFHLAVLRDRGRFLRGCDGLREVSAELDRVAASLVRPSCSSINEESDWCFSCERPDLSRQYTSEGAPIRKGWLEAILKATTTVARHWLPGPESGSPVKFRSTPQSRPLPVLDRNPYFRPLHSSCGSEACAPLTSHTSNPVAPLTSPLRPSHVPPGPNRKVTTTSPSACTLPAGDLLCCCTCIPLPFPSASPSPPSFVFLPALSVCCRSTCNSESCRLSLP